MIGEEKLFEQNYNKNEDLIEHEYEQIKNYRSEFYPKFIIPHIEILSENENIPFNILEHIEKVNQLFWADKSGCANKIRIVIEEILTFKKVPKTVLNKKRKRVRYNLNQRIELIDEKFPKLFNYLSAIRIIGNKGRHSSEIDNEMVLDAIQILNETLKFLFFDNTKELDNIIKSHLKNKMKKK